MGTGYDIGASLSSSQAATASNSAPLSNTGGGGSYSVTINRGSGSAASSPVAAANNLAGYLPYIVLGVVALAGLALFLFKK